MRRLYSRAFGRVGVELQFQPRDTWIGVYWQREEELVHVYVCIVPFLPVVVHVVRR